MGDYGAWKAQQADSWKKGYDDIKAQHDKLLVDMTQCNNDLAKAQRENRDLRRDNHKLRAALLYEARVVEAHYEGYKSFPKGRLRFAEAQVERMRQLARGLWPQYYGGDGYNGFRQSEREVSRFDSGDHPVSSEVYNIQNKRP